MSWGNLLLAQSPSGSGASLPEAAAASATTESASQDAIQSTFEFGRLVNFVSWEWLLLAVAVLAIIVVVIYFYIRDCVELGKGLAVVLILLRVTAFGGLLWIFLQPQYRRSHEEVVNSKAIVIVDTSLSMSKIDESASQRRIDDVIDQLKHGQLIPELQKVHEVDVYRFDADLKLVRGFGKRDAKATGDSGDATADNINPGDANEKDANPDNADATATDGIANNSGDAESDNGDPDRRVNWEEALEPQGRETRLGQTLRQLLSDERAAPVAGVVVVTDGRNNAGMDVDSAITLAKELRFPIHTIGLGSELPALSAQVSDFLVPPRAFPGDAYTLTAFVTGSGMESRKGVVEIQRRLAGADDSTAEVVNSEEITFGEDGEVIAVPFEMKSEEPGRFMLKAKLRVNEPRLQNADQAKLENEKIIDVVDYKTRVLLFASGPTREYLFVRNQLNRDESMIVDVLLQNAREGISQDANEILDEFPLRKTELYEYDAIVAFDPDWRELSETQVELLQDWVAAEAGGLIVIPGPVFTDLWVQSKQENLKKIRALYPVEMPQNVSVIRAGEFDNTEAWPLAFTSEGLSADFLWLEDTPLASEAAWATFEGVYGFYDVSGAKPGATIYSRFSNPSENTGSGQPVYMAGQFYGSGRVFYFGSGESWRLRSLDVGYFEALWTKLVRHVSQGRLLRGSQRAILLVERDKYQLGESVIVRAQMKDASLEPLVTASVEMEVITPGADRITVPLKPTMSEAGTYEGQFPVYKEGTFRLRMQSPDASSEVAERTIEVKLPQLESENTQRNDALLEEIAKETGGQMYLGFEDALEPANNESLFNNLPSAERTLVLADRPQSLWDNQWTLFAIVGVLCAEWLIRRLCKLA
ncbi:MAG: hypothetical protein MPJ50_16645 [Pirellulales bacterium]|nr:hypothetical protein [Pirellulales bacterium]